MSSDTTLYGAPPPLLQDAALLEALALLTPAPGSETLTVPADAARMAVGVISGMLRFAQSRIVSSSSEAADTSRKLNTVVAFGDDVVDALKALQSEISELRAEIRRRPEHEF